MRRPARAPEAPIRCRVYLEARYATDYPAPDRRRRFVALVHGLGEGGFGDDSEQGLNSLLAPRRRGVRRGRRVAVRAARAMSRLDAQCRSSRTSSRWEASDDGLDVG